MSTRPLLASATLILATLFAPKPSQAGQTPDLRHQDGVEVMELQRDGFGEVMGKLWKLTRIAERSILPGTTSAERYQLDARFHALVFDIGQIATLNIHGWSPLNAQLHISVQDAPGSSAHVIVSGVDVSPASLAIDSLYVYQAALAQNALPVLVGARAYITSWLQGNCADFSSLGVDANCGSTVSFCPGGVNSSGWDGLLHGNGSLVAGRSDQLRLKAFRCPAGSVGWFIAGRNTTNLPYGNGELCIHPGAPGFMRISPGVVVAGDGEVDLSLADVSPSFTSLIQPGSTWYFQFLFDDSDNSTVNTTNALQVTFEP